MLLDIKYNNKYNKLIKENIYFFNKEENNYSFNKEKINNIISSFNIEDFWNFQLGSVKSNSILTPWYITGMSDGEGSFQTTIQDIKGKGETGYKTFLEFKITQKNHSVGILHEIKKFFGYGRINVDNNKTSTMKFIVTNINDLMNKVIPHFDKYSLKTSKHLNCLDFKKAVIIMNEKKHYSIEGIKSLKEIKSKMKKSRLFQDKFNYC